MKTLRWLAALTAATLLLAACGSMSSTTHPEATLVLAEHAVAEPITPDNDAPEDWKQDASWTCFFLEPAGPSASGFWLYPPVDNGVDYVWTLVIVQRGGMHYVFENPAVGTVVGGEDGGYDSVIGCKTPMEPEEEEGEWCSPGYWRQPHHLDSWEATGFATTDLFSVEIGYVPSISRLGQRAGAPTDPTLLQVLEKPQWYGGDAFNAVGDLLSAAHPDVNFTGERVEDSCPLN